MSDSKTFETSISINASAAEVWDALTNPELTRQYMFNCDVESNWQVGSDVVWRGAADGVVYVKGKVVQYEPHSVLGVTTFDPNSDMEDVPENHLTGTYYLTEQDGSTHVKVIQGDFASVENGEKRFEDAEGAWIMALDLLKTLLEQ